MFASILFEEFIFSYDHVLGGNIIKKYIDQGVSIFNIKMKSGILTVSSGIFKA